MSDRGMDTTLPIPLSSTERQRRYRATAKGRAADARHNARRIYVGGTYVGTESTFPAPREAVARFARGLIEQHRKETAQWHA